MRRLMKSEILPFLPVVIFLVMWGLVAFLWPAIAAKMKGTEQYWFLRTKPLLILAIAPLGCLAIGAAMPLHLRNNFAKMTFLCTLGLMSFYGYQEYVRLEPHVTGTQTWGSILFYADMFIVAGSIIALISSIILVRLSLVTGEPIKRVKNKAALGDADWMKIDEAKRLFSPEGGIVVGEAYRVDRDIVKDVPFRPGDKSTWGTGGTAPLLTFGCNFGSTHSLVFAGSGGFKTTSTVVPTCLSWKGPLVVLDPSTEIAPLVRDFREKELNRRMFVLTPGEVTGFNVLDWITTSKNPEQDVATVAQWLLSETPRQSTGTDNYFQMQAHNLLTGLLAYVALSEHYDGPRNLRGLRQLISKPEPSLRTLLNEIHETASSDFIRETVGVFINMVDQTFSGVYSSASKDTQWLSFPEYADLVCGNSFTTHQLTTGEIDVVVNLPVNILQTYPGLARVIVGSLINAMVQADGAHKERVLFLLDEVNLLGTMKTLETARDVGRKYGVTLMMIYQTIAQLKRHFGNEGKTSWFESASFISFAAVNDLEVATEVSRRCGEMTVETHSSSKTGGLLGDSAAGKVTSSTNQTKRPLIMPHEVMQEMRSDEQIVFVAGRPPLRCGRAIYFRRTDMKKSVGQNRFAPA